MLVRLVYASRATRSIDEALQRDILTQSRHNNARDGITGILCAAGSSGVFLQALEGSRAGVNRLYAKLLVDRRHENVTLISFDEIEERRFTAWQMGSVDLEKVNRGTILRFSERPELDPFALSARAAWSLLEELAERASVGRHEPGRRGPAHAPEPSPARVTLLPGRSV